MPLKIRLDSLGREFNLSDKCLEAMAATLWHTKAKERGFALCQAGEAVVPSEEHIGGLGSISQRDCRPLRHVGYYHTHPKPPSTTGMSTPSWGDAYNILKLSCDAGQPHLGCRGGAHDKTIRCDTVRTMPSEQHLKELRKDWGRFSRTLAEKDPRLMMFLATPYTFPVGKVPELIKPAPVPVPAPPPPPELVKEPLYRDGVLVGFTIKYPPSYRRAQLLQAIRAQHPDISQDVLDNSQVVYADGFASVKLATA